MFQLKSVYIEKYKNIQDQTFDFSNSNGYVALIGLNGSGKSNLLEAISLIFKGLLFDGKSVGFKYIVIYEIDGVEYERKNRVAKRNGVIIKREDMIYPSSVIACYSGEDSRLWESAYEKYYMQYFKKAVRDVSYVPTLMYVNKYSWKIAFIALLCSSKENVLRFLHDNLGVNDISDVTIKIKADDTKRETFKDHLACRWYDRIKQLQNEDEKHELNANVLASTDMMTYGAGKQEDPARVFQFLYLLSMPEKNKPEGQTIDKLITDISLSIGSINFDSLSEGEKKMILIECITQVLGNENSLVLLDEPDAHVHVAIKKNLLKLVADFHGQTVLTTHSPMFLNKRLDGYNEDNIFYLCDGKIEPTEPLKKLGELTGNTIDYFEGAFILSSKKILVVEGKYDDKYLEKAINIFSLSDNKYKKLNEIVIFSANSASAAEVVYNQIISPSIDKIDKVVFLFDYDDAGWKDGWKKIKNIQNANPKVVPMFYQDNYSSTAYPTTDADVTSANGSNCIKSDKSYMVEDMFSEDSYASIISPVITARKHKDFRQISYGKKGTAGAIKEHIENNYQTFNATWYNGFKPVLDKLMEVFGLN